MTALMVALTPLSFWGSSIRYVAPLTTTLKVLVGIDGLLGREGDDGAATTHRRQESHRARAMGDLVIWRHGESLGSRERLHDGGRSLRHENLVRVLVRVPR